MDSVIKKAKDHCTKLLLNSRCRELPFHNLDHTLSVFDHVKKIGFDEGIDRPALELLCLAALFHDTGNADSFEGHEKISAAYAEAFLKREKFESKKIHLVKKYIMATKIPQRPMNVMERILCDADLHHLGKQDFLDDNERLRKEWECYKNVCYTDHDWYVMNIDFLQAHTFHTLYGKQNLEPIKQDNIRHFEQFITNIGTT